MRADHSPGGMSQDGMMEVCACLPVEEQSLDCVSSTYSVWHKKTHFEDDI
jgi:hypothetical protein